VTVRQSDAHAWCEIWLENTGWQRIDPTSVIVPERITSGFEGYLESQAAQSGETGLRTSGFASWQNAIRDVRLLWDSLAYRWDLWVLNYDEEGQRSFLLLLGLGAWEWTSLAGFLVAGVILFVGIIGLWVHLSTQQRKDPLAQWYGRFCSRMASWGVIREPWEGPEQFTRRATALLPQQATGIQRAGDLYVLLRYSPSPPRVEEFIAEVRALESLPKKGTSKAPVAR
jgi:hypothetical protein